MLDISSWVRYKIAHHRARRAMMDTRLMPNIRAKAALLPSAKLFLLAIAAGLFLSFLITYAVTGHWPRSAPASQLSPSINNALNALSVIIVFLIAITIGRIVTLILKTKKPDFSVPECDLSHFRSWLATQHQDVQDLAPSDQFITQKDIDHLHWLATSLDELQSEKAHATKKAIQKELGTQDAQKTTPPPRRRLL